MGLKEQIGNEIKAAMKMPDKTRLETLRTLRAALMEREIEKRGSGNSVTSEDEIAVMMSAAKKRKESIEAFEKGGRTELVEQESICQNRCLPMISPRSSSKSSQRQALRRLQTSEK
jgi:uncharacterized protein YqeY